MTKTLTQRMDEHAARNHLHLWIVTNDIERLRTAVRLVGADEAERMLKEMR